MATGESMAAPLTVARTWRPEWKRLTALAPVVVVLAWAYAEPLQRLSQRWAIEPDYNHGFLVPLFAFYLLWSRRGVLHRSQPKGSWWGLALVLFAVGLRAAAVLFFYPTLEAPSLIPCLAGVVLLVAGWNGLRWAWPSLLFLVFMMPLPAVAAGLFSRNLQRLATLCSTWLLQLFGVPAISQGNTIRLTHGEIGVVEACSGLRMLIVFLAITVAASFLIDRPVWEKLLIAASAPIIGCLANIVRVTATALLFESGDPGWARLVLHDLAGWLMMPLAVLLLVGELWLLSRLLVETDEEIRPLVLAKPSSPNTPNTTASGKS